MLGGPRDRVFWSFGALGLGGGHGNGFGRVPMPPARCHATPFGPPYI